MKQLIRSLLVSAAILFANIIHAQTGGDVFSDTNTDMSGLSDLQVEEQAVEMTPPNPAADAPQVGTFWSAQHAPGSAEPWPPLPENVINAPVWNLGDGVFLLSDLDFDYNPPVKFSLKARSGMGALDFGADDVSPDLVSPTPADYSTNLWLAITNLAGNTAGLLLSNTEADIQYEIQGAANLTDTNWISEGFVLGSELTNWTPMSVAATNYPNLFLRVRSWADDGSGLPIWWQLQYFGTTGIDPYADPDGDGRNNLQEFQDQTDPTAFNTPPAPQGLTVNYNSINGTATISWLSSPGAITGYTVEKDNSFAGTTEDFNFSASTATFENDVSSDEADPFSGNTLDVTYKIRAHYSTSGDSAWSSPVPLQQITISANIIAGPEGSAYVAVSALPPGTTALRLSRIDEGFFASISSDFSYNTNFDISVTNLADGLYWIPPSWIIMSPDGYGETTYDWYVHTVNTNGNVSAGIICLYPGYSPPIEDIVGYVWLVPPYFDGRQQIKDNLRFLLRAATETPFTFKEVFNDDLQTIFTWPANYIYADFAQGTDPLRPIWDNHFYRNFVFDPANLDTNGDLTTGCYDGDFFNAPDFSYESNLYITNNSQYLFNVDDYVTATSPVILPSLLTSSQTEWIRPQVTGDFFSATTGATNVYGLPTSSVEDAIVSSSLVLATYFPGDSIPGGLHYPGTVQPNFETVEYDFWHSSPLPGASNFSTSQTNDLLITSAGDSIGINGYAKLSVQNGYSGVYGYLGQYFDKAYRIDTNGIVTTNATGVVSPYGQYFATEPGPAALVTMPDIDTGACGTATVYAVSLQLDANHDGNMDMLFNSADATSLTSPMRFWVDSDNDGAGIGQEITTSKFPDYSYGQIRSQRGLEDFARLWICGVPSLPSSQGYTITLVCNAVSGSPAINLFTAETNGGTLYITDTNTAQSLIGEPALGTISSGSTYIFPDNFFDGSNKHFLFEGAGFGEGQFMLTIYKNGNLIAQTSIFIDLHDIKEMYQRAIATPYETFNPPYNQGGSSDYTNNVLNESVLGFINDTTYPFEKASDETPQCVVFVHGWNMSYGEDVGFSETMFKRLYWQGYRGRFCSFYWATLTSFNSYNTSEFRAWKYGLSFKQYVENLKTNLSGYTMSIAAHSMGNVVVGSALQRGLAVDNYVLMQAAVPAGCYDIGGSINNYTPFTSLESSHPTPDFAVPNLGYRGYLTNVTGNLVNFFNTNDFALVTGNLGTLTHIPFLWWIGVSWENNQENFKPDFFNLHTTFYNYVPTAMTGQQGQFLDSTETILHYVTDPHEMMSFAARPRSQAVGAKKGVGGVITSEVDLTGSFNFRNGRDEHSAQFNWNIQRLNGFYAELLAELFPEEP